MASVCDHNMYAPRQTAARRPPMIYQIYQAQEDLLHPVRRLARYGAGMARLADMGHFTPISIRQFGAACSMVAEAVITHRRPSFGFDSVKVGDQLVGVTEEVVDETPFASLLHFRKNTSIVLPRLLVVAPMSGHFATLLRGTLKVLLPEHDVYITDWKNARDVPLSDGRFNMDDFVSHVIRFLEVIGPGGHIIAVCQPAPAALIAVAVMAEAGNPAQPRSMTLMAGPIDTRISPTNVNALAKSRSIDWFEQQLIGRVPWRYMGAGRKVYPGFLQLTAFVGMNLDRHVQAHLSQFRALAGGDAVSARAHRAFYNEYSAVMDLPAEFYLQTVKSIFQDHDLPLGRMTWNGQKVKPSAIQHTALLTIEGERDDICAVGQTMAALDLCSGIRVAMKAHHLQTGVGHYGVFNGSRWAREIYPKVRQIIQVTN
jgi:poly(3-hydroxybutyrate) depolymerase